MKLGPTVAALALIAGVASLSTSAFSQSKEPPHALTAPTSSFMAKAPSTSAPKARVMSFAAKTAPRVETMPKAPKGTNPGSK
jgi:hypothetical protein